MVSSCLILVKMLLGRYSADVIKLSNQLTRLASIMWTDLIQRVYDLKGKTWGFPEKKEFCPKTGTQNPVQVSRLWACLVSQILDSRLQHQLFTNFPVTLPWFYFSREPCLMHNWNHPMKSLSHEIIPWKLHNHSLISTSLLSCLWSTTRLSGWDEGNSTAYYFQLHIMGPKAEISVLSYHRFLEMNFLPSEVLLAKLQAQWNLHSRKGH